MRITILAGGSRGDTQPFVALGVALKKAGHDVRVTAHENFQGFVEGLGLEFHPLGGDVTRVVGDEGVRKALEADNPLKMLRSFRTLKALAYDMQKDHYAACQGADAVVYHPGAAIGYFAAREMDVPSVLASPFPMTPTREYPALLFYNSPRLGGWANLITHKLFERTLWLTAGSPLKRFWKEAFGEPPKAFASPFPRQRTASHPTVVSCSEHVFPRPADWPEHVHATGYWFLDEEAGWEPPEDLLAFLEAGPPPVYVGFGSMHDPDSARTTATIVDALERSEKRGVLATGWGGVAETDGLPESVYVLESAPHAWLFPKVSAVVHHGGAGTTAAGLRSGVPSVVVPHANDQFAWGRRVSELGVGPRPIPRKRLTAERLAAAIREASSQEVVGRARALGETIRRENGAETAAEVIVDSIQAFRGAPAASADRDVPTPAT